VLPVGSRVRAVHDLDIGKMLCTVALSHSCSEEDVNCAPSGVSGRTGNAGCAKEVGRVTNKRGRLITLQHPSTVVINTDGDRYAPFVGLGREEASERTEPYINS
jgi:hypothetical protein